MCYLKPSSLPVNVLMLDAQADFKIFRGGNLVQIATINQRFVLKGPEHVITQNRDVLFFMLMLKCNTRLKMTHTSLLSRPWRCLCE